MPSRINRLHGLASRLKLAVFLVGLPALAALAATNDSPWLRLSWLSDDGLANNTVGGIVQTADGFLWIGTPNGLARFDGVHFKDFESTSFIREPNRGVLTMVAGSEGGLWLGMDRGAVVRLNEGRIEIVTPPHELENLSINSLTEDADGSMWVAYRGGTVCRVSNGNLKTVGQGDDLPAGRMCALALDEDGQLWFARAGRLGIVQDEQFEVLERLDSSQARLAPARGGGVWVCSGYRLYRYRKGEELRLVGEFTPLRSATEPSAILESQDGAVWVGTTFSGLYRFDGRSFHNVPTTHLEILTLKEDAEGSIWVGTGGGGLNQIRPRLIHLEAAESGLPFQAVLSLAEDTNGVIWAAAQNGSLARRVNEQWVAVPTGTNWAGDAVTICAEPTGGLWVGTRGHRLQRWLGDDFMDWGDPRQIKGQTIRTMLVTKTGDLWIGEDTPTAVQRLRNGQVENYEVPPDIRVIRASAEDANGDIWYGTSKGVLLRVEGKRLVDHTPDTTGEPRSIRCLYGTPDGSLWIGYAGYGLGRWKAGRYTAITARQGLQDDFISQIVADGRGWLWFGANRGIFKVRQEEVDAVMDGKAARVHSIHYGAGDGLPGLQANFGSSPMGLRSRDGRVWLAMRTALAVVSPQTGRDDSPPPPVLIERVSLGDRTVAAYGGVLAVTQSPGGGTLDLSRSNHSLRIPPDHRRLEFEFTALSFVGAENVAFRYRLDGMDEEWATLERGRGAVSSAVYPRLPAGEYEFRVNACNSEGLWNEADATLAFVVPPFFYQTWWFRSTVLVAFTGLIIAIVRYVSFRRLRLQLQHLEQQAALHRERARIAKDIHDDLGANLTQISLIGELARQDRDTPEKVSTHLEKISGTARQAVKSLDEIVWAVNPRNDTLVHFIDYTGQYALDYLRIAGVRCRLDLPEEVPAHELSTEVRHNLFLVVKEAITNSVKHAHAAELRLQVKLANDKLSIVIEDNGRGFEQPQENATSDGLRNMRQRMAEIGGDCWIQGRPGAGAKVSLELPWVVGPNHP